MNYVCNQKLKIGSNYITEFNRIDHDGRGAKSSHPNTQHWRLNQYPPSTKSGMCAHFFHLTLMIELYVTRLKRLSVQILCNVWQSYRLMTLLLSNITSDMSLWWLFHAWWLNDGLHLLSWLWWLVDKHMQRYVTFFLADWYRRQKLLWNCYLAYEAALAQPTSRNSWPTNAFGRMIADELFIDIEANVTFKTNSKTDFWCKYKNWNFSSKWNLFSSYNSITQRRSQATERRVNHL